MIGGGGNNQFSGGAAGKIAMQCVFCQPSFRTVLQGRSHFGQRTKLVIESHCPKHIARTDCVISADMPILAVAQMRGSCSAQFRVSWPRPNGPPDKFCLHLNRAALGDRPRRRRYPPGRLP